MNSEQSHGSPTENSGRPPTPADDGIKKNQIAPLAKSSLIEQAETQTAEANLRTYQANLRTDKANARIEKADERTAAANARTEQADLRTEKAEEQVEVIRISEMNYRRLFESARDGIMILEADTGRVTDVNPFLVELLGFSHDEMVGKTLSELSPFKDSLTNQAMLELLQKDRYVRPHDLPLETKDGRQVDVEFVSNSYQVDDAKVIQCNIREITDRKQAEASQHTANVFLAEVINAIPVRVFWKDKNLVYLGCNTIFARDAGFANPKEIIGKDDSQMVWREQAEAYRSADREVINSGQSKLLIEESQTTPEGKTISLITSKLPLRDAKGEIIGVLGTYMDISERKQAELVVKQLNRRHELILNSVMDGIHGVDLQGSITFENAAAARMFAHSIDEMIGQPAHPLVHHSHADGSPYPEEQCPINATLRDGVIRRVDDEVFWRKDGSSFPVEYTTAPKRDEHGAIIGAVVVFRDITERKQSENALRETELRLAHAMSLAQLVAWEYDVASGLFYFSDRYFVLHGTTAELEGGHQMSAGNFVRKYVHPDDAHHVADEIGKAVATADPDYRTQLECRIFRRDGELRHVLVSIAISKDAAGRTVQLHGANQDITKRKRAEESHARLATAVEQSAETIVITDTEGTIIYANPAFEQTTGYTCAEALGQNPRLLKSGKQDAAFYRRLWETIQSGKVWSGHFVNKRKDGTLYEEEVTISPIRDAAGKIINFVAVKRDVTHEVELEGQLRQSQKMEAMGTLAGGIAHDFNNILSVIFGYSNLLQLDLAGKNEPLEKVGEILKAGQRAKDLVQQILTFSRQREQERQVIHLNPIIKEVTKLLRSSMPTNIQIETSLAADAPAVLADATQIYQVVMNLGTNALHAMEGLPTGRLTVTLDAFQPDEAFINKNPELRTIKYARLTIADTGCGMDAKTLARIYDPFFTTKPIGKGTGLGLAVAHGIVEAHDGVITVESQPGQGTTFCLYFPEQIQDLFLEGIPEDLIPCGQGQRILMVDDEAVLMGMYQRLLKALKYEGTVVTSPEEAISLVRKNPALYDLVITDLTMPGMNGLEVAREIREIRANLPIILVTGYQGTMTKPQMKDAGICELVEKPISMATLAKVLRGILGKK